MAVAMGARIASADTSFRSPEMAVATERSAYTYVNADIYEDYGRLDEVRSVEQQKITSAASFAPLGLPLGKVLYALRRPQAIVWVKDNLARKMATLYLAAKDYLAADAGVPKELLKIADELFGDISGKPLKPKLLASVLFTAAPWHMRAARLFKLLKPRFERGKKVVSQGCGISLIEILALVAAGNKDARLVCVDMDAVGIGMAMELVELLAERGYDVRKQITFTVADINKYQLPEGTDVMVSIGLLHNYLPLEDAKRIAEKCFEAGVSEVITDIYYTPLAAHNGQNDAMRRFYFVKNVLGWKFGSPKGLRFYSKEELCRSFANHTVDIYDHSTNATAVIKA